MSVLGMGIGLRLTLALAILGCAGLIVLWAVA